MSHESETAPQIDTIPKTPLSESIQQLFSRLRSSDVEQFINAYKFWTLHQEIDLLNLQIALTQQELLANEEQLHLLQPTAIEQAALAQLQASGVSDIDLLDRMHARGELWLDNAIQLLEHCERLDMIQGDYTQWCEHALEGAYDWLSSIDEDDLSKAQPAHTQPPEQIESIHKNELDELPEALLLQKLFSENEEIILQEELLETAFELPTAPPDTAAIPEPNTPDDDEETEVEELSKPSELPLTSQEDLPEESELLETSPDASASEAIATNADQATEGVVPQQPEEAVPQQSDVASPEESTSPNASETELAEPETSIELAIEMKGESLEEENLSASAEVPEETSNTSSFISVSTNIPSPEQESQNRDEQVESQEISENHGVLDELIESVEHTEALDEHTEQAETQEVSEHTEVPDEHTEPVEHTEVLDEHTEPVEHTEVLDESTDLAEEAKETPEQGHNAKRNRLVNRFVGRIFPKG